LQKGGVLQSKSFGDVIARWFSKVRSLIFGRISIH
jgi:hypothetical protein